MDGRRHDVAAVKDLLHHHLVQFGRVAAGALVAGGDLLVDGGEQRAGAAGEVADAQATDGFSVRPVDAFQLGDGEPGQQRGGSGQRVEGGKVFAVGDEPLKDAPGQVVGVFDAGRADGLGGVTQAPQDAGRVGRVQVLEDLPGDAENGPVVDVENGGPGLKDFALRVGYTVIADLREGIDARVHAGDLVVEDEGVGDDGAGHAAGLAHVGHAQQAGDLRGDAGTGPVYLVEVLGRGVDAFL